MNTFLKNTLKTVTLGLFLALAASSVAHAQATRTWVSGVGDDANPCTRTAPCATFAGALAKTAAAGEIDALDTGDFGPVTISNAVTIDGTGANASIVVPASSPAVTINAGTGNTVILRHLSVISLPGNGSQTTTFGISLASGNLVVDDCHIAGFNSGFSDGISLGSSGNSVVTNTIVTGCSIGISNSGTGLVSLRNDTLQGNGSGLSSQGGPTDISHSLISQNPEVGISALQGTVSVSDCMISGNNIGVYTVSGAIIRLTNNDIFNNTTGIDTVSSGGTVSTTGNNRKAGNGTPGAPTPGRVITQQ